MNRIAYLLLALILMALLLVNCNREVEFVPYKPQVVVEGQIENGQYASVLLSTSVSFTELMDTTSLLDHAIRNAKITISDGDKSEILLLKVNKKKIPPYEYVTQRMKGEIGKTYTLTIEYDDKIISAETYIPEPVIIDSLWFSKKTPSDRIGYVHISFKNVSNHHYRIATKEESEDIYIPCLYGNVDKTLYPKETQIKMQINKGPIIFPETSYTSYFPDSVDIKVKLSTQLQASYDFWTSYQNEIINSQNPIFPSTQRLKSNVKGGIGIWAGYGSSVKTISGKDYQ